MYLKVLNDIENNVFSTSITVDSFGSEFLSDEEEKELLENFPVKVAYRNLVFTKNVKIEGSVPVITDEEADSNTIVTVTLPPLSNREIPITKDFNAYYKIDYSKIPSAVVDENVLTKKELIAQAYCLVFSSVICDTVKEIMDSVRSKAPAFEGENIISV